MSKADYPYPDDEFDAPPDPTAPRGVHRAPRSAWSRWWPFLLVLVLAPLLAYGVVAYVTRGGDATTSIGGSDADDEPTATAPATPGADEGESTDGATDGSTDEGAGDEQTDEESPAATPNMATPITVYNAAGIGGLAATGAGKLETAGFTSVAADNFTGTKPAASTVYYGSDDDRATADLVASTLGLSAVQQDLGMAPSGIVVVLVTALS